METAYDRTTRCDLAPAAATLRDFWQNGSTVVTYKTVWQWYTDKVGPVTQHTFSWLKKPVNGVLA